MASRVFLLRGGNAVASKPCPETRWAWTSAPTPDARHPGEETRPTAPAQTPKPAATRAPKNVSPVGNPSTHKSIQVAEKSLLPCEDRQSLARPGKRPLQVPPSRLREDACRPESLRGVAAARGGNTCDEEAIESAAHLAASGQRRNGCGQRGLAWRPILRCRRPCRGQLRKEKQVTPKLRSKFPHAPESYPPAKPACSGVASKSRKPCRKVAPATEFCPIVGRIWMTSANTGRQFADVCHALFYSSKFRPSVAKHWPLSTKSRQVCPNVARIGPSWAEFGPKLARSGQVSGRCHPHSTKKWPNLGSWGKCSTTRAQRLDNSRARRFRRGQLSEANCCGSWATFVERPQWPVSFTMAGESNILNS